VVTIFSACRLISSLWNPTSILLLIAVPLTALSSVATGSVKGVVWATTQTAGTRRIILSNARLTLRNRALPTQVIESVSDDAGAFAFTNLAASTYLLTAEASGLATVSREIDLSEGANVTVEVELNATVSESVTVKDEEGLLSTAETTTSNVLRAETLKNLPLRAENYQSAIPLTPGMVRGPTGENNLKGASAGQSAYTVNGADVTDPATGRLAFDIPIEAAASVQIEENPYSAEFGRLTGGATNLETKGGTNKFTFTLARFFPTFRYIATGPIDSFRPRLTFSGPILKDKLFFLQSFEYRFARLRVPSLEKGHDDSPSESFNSFTQIDYILNSHNRLKFVAALFPQKARNVGLNTFNPQEATPNVKQHGTLFTISEQMIFSDASFLSSAVNYKTFDVDVFGKGERPLTLSPEGNTGNYFANMHRETERLQWQENYYARPFNAAGQHALKLGMELDHTRISSRFRDNPIFIRRINGTLAQRIEFTSTGPVDFRVGEQAAFVQDRWTASRKLTVDLGLRFDRDGIARRNNLAPRLSLMFLPFKNKRTIIRGGVGIFYDRMPLSVGYLDGVRTVLEEEEGRLVGQTGLPSNVKGLPARLVTRFAGDGTSITDGPRLFSNLVDRPLHNLRSVRWSLQLDQGLTKNLTMRIGYLQRATSKVLIVDPVTGGLDTGALILGSRGRSRYNELQLLAIYDNPRWGYWTASYVASKAQGDLNTIDSYLGDFPAFVIRPNEYGPLPFDVPNRFLAYGEVNLPSDIILSPSFELRSGFPFSAVDEQLEFVGPRNRTGRYPAFMSLDAQVTKGFRIPKFEKHKMRLGIAVFNITNHFNPRDVQNNLSSPRYGKFFNSLGTSIRGKFEIDF
jgi:hypothetical protein